MLQIFTAVIRKVGTDPKVCAYAIPIETHHCYYVADSENKRCVIETLLRMYIAIVLIDLTLNQNRVKHKEVPKIN